MRAKVSNALNGLTLVGLGTVFVIFYATGRIDRYLNPIFRPLVLFVGAGAVIVGLVYLLTIKLVSAASTEIVSTVTLISQSIFLLRCQVQLMSQTWSR
jgi:uncharacterized membrane protein YcgQ (UPF0703/DUF1980 family)